MDNKDNFCGKYDVICPSGNGTLNVSRSGAYYRFELLCPPSGGIVHLYCINGTIAVNIGVPLPSNDVLVLDKRISRSLLSPLGDKIEYCVLAKSSEDALSCVAIEDAPVAVAGIRDISDPTSVISDNENTDSVIYTDDKEAEEPDEKIYSNDTVTVSAFEDANSTFIDENTFSEPIQDAADACSATSKAADEWMPADCSLFECLPQNCGAMMRTHNGIIQIALPVSSEEPFALPSLLRWGIPATINNSRYLLYRAENGMLSVM